MTTHIDATMHRDDFVVTVDLELNPGETTALVGPNGAGKSTIVDAIAGLLRVRAGTVKIAGRVVDAPGEGIFVSASARNVGVVFQDLLLFPHLRVVDNVAFGARAKGMGKAQARAVAGGFLDSLDLGSLASRFPSELSGGQRQRVALARAMASQPELLLLDEPLSALDVETRSSLRRRLGADLATFDGPRLLITHDPADAFVLADQVVVLENGTIRQKATPDSLRRHPKTPYAASFSGRNLLSASASDGLLEIDDVAKTLQTADRGIEGAVLVSIAPSAIALHHEQPQGSPRNAWQTTIEAIEPIGDVRRVLLASPLPLSADLTPGAVESMGLAPGSSVWASIKATEVHVTSVS